MEVTGDVAHVTDAINAFPVRYHTDFSDVRSVGLKYVTDSRPTDATATALARTVHRVLINWGAGKRKAPKLREPREFEAAFFDPEMHSALASLAQLQIPNLGVVGVHRLLDSRSASRELLSAIDSRLLTTLGTLADRLFVDNTNVTYPMKVVLLVTGLMPAFDSQVRAGLGRGGFAGLAATRFLLPKQADSADGQKITRLPFVLGECWKVHSWRLIEAVQRSKFPELVHEPGRIFDVLLFMQAQPDRPVILKCVGDGARWYAID